MTVAVELLWWSGCPSHPRARQLLAEVMTEVGLDPATVVVTQVVTPAEARDHGFVGSPTIRVDGRDIVPPDPEAPPALTCRLYFSADGSPSPLPERAAVRSALWAALGAD